MGLFLLSGPVSQHLINPGHNVIGAREGNRVSQCLVALQRPDLHAVRPVLCPALRQPHQPFAFRFRQKTDTAALRVALIPEGKGRYITG